jgi:pimeloyl-ACP methyl ester carboxylesterase
VAPALRDVAAYLTRHRVRESVLEAVSRAVPPAGEVVLVAHGLGGIVAVDLMTRLPREVRVTGLVTLGVPLGLEAVRHRLVLGGAVLPRPVPTWLDVWSAADPLSVGAPLRRAWLGQVTGTRELPAGPGGTPDALAYLGDPVVSDTVGALLARAFVPRPAGPVPAPAEPVLPPVPPAVSPVRSKVGTNDGHGSSCSATVRSGAGRSHARDGF